MEIVVHLMDGVDPEVLLTAERASLNVAGVEPVHARGRWVGRSLLVEIEGFLAGDTTITEARPGWPAGPPSSGRGLTGGSGRDLVPALPSRVDRSTDLDALMLCGIASD